MKIAVIGTGHVGLPTCASLASFGHEVVGVDEDAEKIARLRTGVMPFYEPDLEELVKAGLDSDLLRFTTEFGEAVGGAEVAFICVGTPPSAAGEANLTAVEHAARAAARSATGPIVIVEKSTVPVGTAAHLRQAVADERPDLKIEIASNPEFLREGHAVADALGPLRILIGADSDGAFATLRRVYELLIARGTRMIEADIASAELSKHASNAFLALKISFANALARLCELAGGDIEQVVAVLGSDPRIGADFLGAGLGYGGSCFPKDLKAFQRLAESLGYDFRLLGEIARINEETVAAIAAKVKGALGELAGRRIALLGLAYKPGTDDVRFAPALALARILINGGATVAGYDPQAGANAKADLPELEIASDPYDLAMRADCLVVCTEWPEFADVDLERLKTAMAQPTVVDARNLFDSETMRAKGYTYYPTGRPA